MQARALVDLVEVALVHDAHQRVGGPVVGDQGTGPEHDGLAPWLGREAHHGQVGQEVRGALGGAGGLAGVLDLLRRAVDELDQSVIMVTHDTGAAEHADRVLVCRDGRIVADLRGADQDALAAALR